MKTTKEPMTKKCEKTNCQKEFVTTRRNKRYCTEKCRKNAYVIRRLRNEKAPAITVVVIKPAEQKRGFFRRLFSKIFMK